ncbi:MAG: pilus assembly protein TadG-related protein, partial [Hyphomonadaceae bacterium]|nr:pilus assembly protein TadG-related protein [Hyphomonadaceae bacterium]
MTRSLHAPSFAASSFLDRIRSRLEARRAARKRRGERAVVAITFSLAAVPLTAALGLAVDGSRAHVVATKLQWSLDNAVLAVGSTGLTDTAAKSMVQKYIDANINGPISTANPVPTPVVTRETVTQTATADVDTIFMGVVGIDDVTVGAQVEVRRQLSAMMLALVLDNTGSMWSNNNINSLRSASKDLTDYLFGTATNSPDLRVSVVPYAASVNVGAEAANIVQAHTLGNPNQTAALGWKGCVFERPGALSIDDTAPTNDATRWTPLRWEPSVDNNWTANNAGSVQPGPTNSNGLRGPNLGCPTPIQPLTGQKSLVDASLNGLSAWNRGGTLTDIGIAWGLRTLSPGAPFTQSSEVDPTTGQAIHTRARWQKAMVIMTDGESLFYDLPSNADQNKPHASASDVT